MYRYIKASNVAEDVIQVFERQCKHLQDSGESVSMCIDSLNQFAKAYAEDEDVNVADLQATETESVGADTIEEATEETTDEATSDTIFTLSYKLNAVNNVAVRYSATEGLVTTNSDFEIKQAILFLQEQLNNL